MKNAQIQNNPTEAVNTSTVESMYIREKMGGGRKWDVTNDVVKMWSPREKKIIDKSTHASDAKGVCVCVVRVESGC
jgi:hypothetical protein